MEKKIFYKGGDISELTYLEAHKTKFYDEDGNERDVLSILQEKGFNIVRLRIYLNPGKNHGNGEDYCPAGYLTTEDSLILAKRAKEHGMEIQLSFHYSDYWTNMEEQFVPRAWLEQIADTKSKTPEDVLEDCVYTYTREVVARFVAQDTKPLYVSIGNEIQGGMLYPYGTVENWEKLAKFLKAGIRAVKEIGEDIKVILHLDDGGNSKKYETFFGNCEKYNVKYDVIGASYYPFWTKRTVKELVAFCSEQVQRFDKDILIMETAFNFAPCLVDGSKGQLMDNGPYEGVYQASPEGQKQFLQELFQGLATVNGGRCVGDLYWDPIMVEQPEVGWAYREADGKPEKNIVSNTTLFDFEHKALPALEVYKEF